MQLNLRNFTQGLDIKLMNKIFYILPALLCMLVACGEKDSSQSDNENQPIDSTFCDCTELTFDNPYNHFWRFERRKGYTGRCEEYYPNGQVKISKNFFDGKLHGKIVSFYDNGQVEDEKQFDMNFQTGEQITFSKKGEVIFHALYSRGQQTKVLVSRTDVEKVDPWEEE